MNLITRSYYQPKDKRDLDALVINNNNFNTLPQIGANMQICPLPNSN